MSGQEKKHAIEAINRIHGTEDCMLAKLVTIWSYDSAMEFIHETEQLGSRLGLNSIRLLLQELSNPQDKLSVLHVAGTNGKGSICTFLESCYQTAHYRVGRYSSPTLFSYLERFQINGVSMTEEQFVSISWHVYVAYRRMKARGQQLPTAFEVETAIAFLFFLEQKVDLVVLETGMGGREDATNVVRCPLVTIFSSISMDHRAFLGDSIPAIAKVKAGIMRERVPVVIAPMEAEARRVLLLQAQKKEALVYLPEAEDCHYSLEMTTFTYKGETYEIHLSGTYQTENAVTALAAIDLLQNQFPVLISQKKEGLLKAAWQGRFEVLQTSPYIIRDGAHNEDAVKRLVESLQIYFPERPLCFVMGVFKDKAYSVMVEQIMPLAKRIYTVTPPNSYRALQKEELAQCIQNKQRERNVSFPVQCMNSVIEAKEAFLEKETKDDILVIFGSLSLSSLC